MCWVVVVVVSEPTPSLFLSVECFQDGGVLASMTGLLGCCLRFPLCLLFMFVHETLSVCEPVLLVDSVFCVEPVPWVSPFCFRIEYGCSLSFAVNLFCLDSVLLSFILFAVLCCVLSIPT